MLTYCIFIMSHVTVKWVIIQSFHLLLNLIPRAFHLCKHKRGHGYRTATFVGCIRYFRVSTSFVLVNEDEGLKIGQPSSLLWIDVARLLYICEYVALYLSSRASSLDYSVVNCPGKGVPVCDCWVCFLLLFARSPMSGLHYPAAVVFTRWVFPVRSIRVPPVNPSCRY